MLADIGSNTVPVAIIGGFALVLSATLPALLNRSWFRSNVVKLLEEIKNDNQRHWDRDDVRFRVLFRDAKGDGGTRISDPWPKGLQISGEEEHAVHGGEITAKGFTRKPRLAAIGATIAAAVAAACFVYVVANQGNQVKDAYVAACKHTNVLVHGLIDQTLQAREKTLKRAENDPHSDDVSRAAAKASLKELDDYIHNVIDVVAGDAACAWPPVSIAPKQPIIPPVATVPPTTVK